MHINLKILKCIGFVGLFTAALMGVASFDKTPVFSLWGGLNWENSGKTAEVNLVGSLNNQLFQPTNRYTIGPFVGIDAGERWYFNNRPIYLSLMGELSYTKVVSAYGVEQPQVGSHSDTLNYNYAISDVPLFLVGQFGWYKGMLEGYLIGGIGLSWNTASDFKEIPTNPTSGTASASRGMFQRNTLTEFAYVIGMGAGIEFNEYFTMDVEYRFTGYGDAELKGRPLTNGNTSQPLPLGDVNSNAILLRLIFLFDA